MIEAERRVQLLLLQAPYGARRGAGGNASRLLRTKRPRTTPTIHPTRTADMVAMATASGVENTRAHPQGLTHMRPEASQSRTTSPMSGSSASAVGGGGRQVQLPGSWGVVG